MSETSAFFWRKCYVKSEITTPVSTLSKKIVCEFEGLMREQDQILLFRASALPNSFLLMSAIRESIWCLGGCWVLNFGNSCFVTDCVVTLLLQKLGQEQTVPYKDKWLLTGGVMAANSCNPFPDYRTFLLCFQVVLFNNINQTSSWNFTRWCLFFMACKFSLSICIKNG